MRPANTENGEPKRMFCRNPWASEHETSRHRRYQGPPLRFFITAGQISDDTDPMRRHPGSHPKCRYHWSIYWKLAHPTGFEPVASAFGGQGIVIRGGSLTFIPSCKSVVLIHRSSPRFYRISTGRYRTGEWRQGDGRTRLKSGQGSGSASRRRQCRTVLATPASRLLCRLCTVSEGWGRHVVCPSLSCPLLSGPLTMTVWTKEGTKNACEEAQAGGDHRQAA